MTRRSLGTLLLVAAAFLGSASTGMADAGTAAPAGALASGDYRPTDELVEFRPAVTRSLYERSILRRSSIHC